ncbi:MAG: hypothetical protein MUF49_12540 [Oculatellaceae cyanobacterium Prado106]|nr:hypothetical protein [Oculatellaceae cyanobacterium Prado106]
MSEINEGIQVSGGVFHANQVAVGTGATAVQNIQTIAQQLQESGQGEVAAALTQLLAAIETQGILPAAKTEATEAVQAVAEEVQKETPNKFTLKGLLTTLKESLGSVAEIAEKITVLQKAICLMMGLPTL